MAYDKLGQGNSVPELEAWMRKEFGFSEGQDLFYVDDWSLIIRLHAMIETGLNDAIIRELNRPELEDVVARLDTSSAAGKVAFSKALGIISSDFGAFIQQLSTLRNLCVHNIKNFQFDLKKYLDGLDDAERKTIVKPIVRALGPSDVQLGGKTINSPEMMSGHPRAGLVIATMLIMVPLRTHQGECQLRDLHDELDRIRAELAEMRELSTPKES